ncbi:hypothetical protein NQ318_023536 [Aromia moschata]|uniref:DUF4371 domain-containing protein n=1 Tax=Aromia moschata TaxID=1265417 RepID=A0AAV8YNV6_9CUCU|nr:hypothetical protein NQ318_023536 [Aromia moschata]
MNKTEQVTLCVRYVNENKNHEDFLQFVPVENLTGESLSNLITSSLEKFGLDFNNLVGQGYDGAKTECSFEKKNDESDDNPSAKTLKRLCATRWTSKYEAVQDFLELFDYVVESLEEISGWKDSGDANMLRNSLNDSAFLVALQIAVASSNGTNNKLVP